MAIYILTEEEIRNAMTLDREALEVIVESFISLSDGRAIVPPIMMIAIPELKAEIDVKAAHIRGLDSCAVKIASGFFLNHLKGLPTSSSLMVLVNATTGLPEAVLLENGYLTHLRTGAAGAVAAMKLAPSRVNVVGVVGVGTQARHQLAALQLVRSFPRVLVHARRKDQVSTFCDLMTSKLGVPVEPAQSLEQLVGASQIVITATPSCEPLIRAEWIHSGMHITAVGADAENKQELFPGVIGAADIVACDLRSQCLRLGELRAAAASGFLPNIDAVVELGELCAARHPGRGSESEVTVCDLTGVGTQDTQIARLAFSRGRALGLGFAVS